MLLVAGCILVASPAFNKHPELSSNSTTTSGKLRMLVSRMAASEDMDLASTLVGIGAVLLMVALSGYSAVYFEGVLKHSEKITIW